MVCGPRDGRRHVGRSYARAKPNMLHEYFAADDVLAQVVMERMLAP